MHKKPFKLENGVLIFLKPLGKEAKVASEIMVSLLVYPKPEGKLAEEIASKLDWEPQEIVGVLNHLKDLGLIDKDKNGKDIWYLSDDGREFLKIISEKAKATQEILLKAGRASRSSQI